MIVASTREAESTSSRYSRPAHERLLKHVGSITAGWRRQHWRQIAAKAYLTATRPDGRAIVTITRYRRPAPYDVLRDFTAVDRRRRHTSSFFTLRCRRAASKTLSRCEGKSRAPAQLRRAERQLDTSDFEYVKSLAVCRLHHVPKGTVGGEDLLGGRSSQFANMVAVCARESASCARGRRGSARSLSTPKIPTVIEPAPSGLSSVRVRPAAPSRTPAQYIAGSHHMVAAMSEREMQERIGAEGAEPASGSAGGFKAARRELVTWSKVIRTGFGAPHPFARSAREMHRGSPRRSRTGHLPLRACSHAREPDWANSSLPRTRWGRISGRVGRCRTSSAHRAHRMGICHCALPRATGSGFAAGILVPRDAVTVTGEVRYHDVVADSGHIISRGFCPVCGSRLFGKGDASPERMSITAGSLDEPALFRPQADIYTASARAWVNLNPRLPKFRKMPRMP